MTHTGLAPTTDRVTVRTAAGLIDCGRSVFDRRRGGLDHGYAVTSYAVTVTAKDATTGQVGTTHFSIVATASLTPDTPISARCIWRAATGRQHLTPIAKRFGC